jgi:hypothetical protein
MKKYITITLLYFVVAITHFVIKSVIYSIIILLRDYYEIELFFVIIATATTTTIV